jgi:hypothetical protein
MRKGSGGRGGEIALGHTNLGDDKDDALGSQGGEEALELLLGTLLCGGEVARASAYIQLRIAKDAFIETAYRYAVSAGFTKAPTTIQIVAHGVISAWASPQLQLGCRKAHVDSVACRREVEFLKVVLDVSDEVSSAHSMLPRFIEIDILPVADLFGDEAQALTDLHLQFLSRHLGLGCLAEELMVDEEPRSYTYNKE